MKLKDNIETWGRDRQPKGKGKEYKSFSSAFFIKADSLFLGRMLSGARRIGDFNFNENTGDLGRAFTEQRF